MLNVRLLGGFDVQVDGTPVADDAWRLRKARSVVKVLALQTGRALHPERMQALLWPDRDRTAAANNLRQALYQARRALATAGADGAAVLSVRGDLLMLCSDGDIALDIDAFGDAAGAADRTGAPAELERALAAYGGELLPEDPYEPWAADARRALAERHLGLLLTLAALRTQTGDHEGAADPLRRALVADPLHEPAHRALMVAYAAAGRRQQALGHYAELRATLDRELATEPEPDTRALYRRLLAEPVETPAVRPPGLPWQPTSFVGRERELTELGRVLPGARLVTLTGPGGCGKTRLAFEAAARRADAHRDGVRAVELAALADPALVSQAVASALGLDLRQDEDADEALATHLCARDMLLVLDNCEHLLGACARAVSALLARCPGVHVLATSRAPMHVPGELDWRVPSLGLVEPQAELERLLRSDAVRLFCQRAAAACAGFVLSAANAAAVAEICWRVDGLPLAIELAAARSAALLPAQVAERLGDALSVLRSARPTGLTRQQTLEATLDWSHDLLSETERRLFRRLAVFAGGFDLPAAESICEADVPELAALVDQSLVVAEEAGEAYRYRLLEPIRQYAMARLREAGELDALAERHARRFAALAAQPGGRVTECDLEQVDRLEREHDNLRAALDWTLARDPAASPAMAAAMAAVWLLRLHLREGSRWLDLALTAAPEASAARCEALHARQAIERRRPLAYSGADELCRQRTALHRALRDRPGEALSLLDAADGFAIGADLPGSVEAIAQAGEIAAELGEPALVAAVLEREGMVHMWRIEYTEAEYAYAAALAALAEAGDGPGRSAVLTVGGLVPPGPVPSLPHPQLEETALHFRRVEPALSRAYVLGHRAYVDRILGRHADARVRLEEALGIVRSNRDVLGEGLVLAQRGNVEREAGDLDAAEMWLTRSLALRRRVLDLRGVLTTLLALGVVKGRAGDRAGAEALLEQPRRMAADVVDGPAYAGYCMAMADVAESADDAEAARRWLTEALTEFLEPTGLGLHASWVHVAAARHALALGDSAGLRHHLARAREYFASSGVTAGPAYCDALLTPC